MSSQAIPNYNVPAPQINSTMQTIGGLMNLRSQINEAALRGAQIEQAKQQTELIHAEQEQKNRDLADQNTLQGLSKDPEAYAKIFGGDLSPLAGKVQPKTIAALQTNIDAHHKELAANTKEDLANRGAALGQLVDTANGLLSFGDDIGAINSALPEAVRNLNDAGVFKNAKIDPSKVPTSITDVSQLKQWLATTGALQAANDKALSVKKTQGEVDEKAAQTALTKLTGQKTEAEIPGEKAKSTKEQIITQGMQDEAKNPAAGDKKIDDALPPSVDQQANAGFKSAYHAAIAAGSPEAAARVVEAAANHNKDMSPASIQHKVNEEAALEPGKVRVAKAGAMARADAATPGSDALDLMAEDALSGKPPSSRNPVINAKVWDRAAAIAKSRGLSTTEALMARNAAQASKGALDSLTKQYETLKPFAEMAEKNANVLESAISKVSNLGASVLNTPLREIESKFAGNPNVSAFKAAILPVQADFARILNSPTGGGILSDHARAEMEAAIKPGATPSEMKAALDIFRQDARNRKESYEATLADLKASSVAGASKPAAATPANRPPLSSFEKP